MSFNDIFKSSYLENVSAIDIPDMIIALVLAFLVGLFIYVVFRRLTGALCIPQVSESPS